jgi:hypothetical protein
VRRSSASVITRSTAGGGAVVAVPVVLPGTPGVVGELRVAAPDDAGGALDVVADPHPLTTTPVSSANASRAQSPADELRFALRLRSALPLALDRT